LGLAIKTDLQLRSLFLGTECDLISGLHCTLETFIFMGKKLCGFLGEKTCLVETYFYGCSSYAILYTYSIRNQSYQYQ